ncbi:hypothetical protein S7711_10268, partial [Stachybotrys chartarum IBT 7711]
ATP